VKVNEPLIEQRKSAKFQNLMILKGSETTDQLGLFESGTKDTSNHARGTRLRLSPQPRDEWGSFFYLPLVSSIADAGRFRSRSQSCQPFFQASDASVSNGSPSRQVCIPA
jgi:hypothetical protein